MSTAQTPPPWLLKRVPRARSTNDLAKDLAPWQAISAETQEAGRGRYGRKFVCSEGGVWLSAVVPIPGEPARWTGLALAVGWGILGWLRSIPVEGARLRWPNDLMVNQKKLGGILLEQSSPARCVVGVGINIFNDPAADDPELEGVTTCLKDCVGNADALPQKAEECIPSLLEGIANGWKKMHDAGLEGMTDLLNESWGGKKQVEIRPVDGAPVCGEMVGIDTGGAIVIALPDGGGRSFPAHWIERMVELS